MVSGFCHQFAPQPASIAMRGKIVNPRGGDRKRDLAPAPIASPARRYAVKPSARSHPVARIQHKRGVSRAFASPLVAVLVGLGLIIDGRIEQALLEFGIAGDVGELPILGSHPVKKIFAIRHRCWWPGFSSDSNCAQNVAGRRWGKR
jgi:hypothetical protein